MKLVPIKTVMHPWEEARCHIIAILAAAKTLPFPRITDPFIWLSQPDFMLRRVPDAKGWARSVRHRKGVSPHIHDVLFRMVSIGEVVDAGGDMFALAPGCSVDEVPEDLRIEAEVAHQLAVQHHTDCAARHGAEPVESES